MPDDARKPMGIVNGKLEETTSVFRLSSSSSSSRNDQTRKRDSSPRIQDQKAG